jgi:hypothetical protein
MHDKDQVLHRIYGKIYGNLERLKLNGHEFAVDIEEIEVEINCELSNG